VTRGLPVLLSVSLLGAFVSASGPPAGNATAGVHLTAINSHVNGGAASLVIEASDPTPYVATSPDPLTVLVDFRNVNADGVANSVVASAKGPIAGVLVEPAELMGAPASRVRISLLQPVAHRVHSERNRVVIDFEKPSNAAPSLLAPAAREAPLDAMKALDRVGGTAADPIAALGRNDAREASSTAFFAQKPGTTSVSPPQPAVATTPPTLADAPASPPGQQSGVTTGERKYTGHPVSLDFQGADLRAVLRTFAEISGLNMVIDPKVAGSVDVALRDVPWDQALDIILRANGLDWRVDGTIVRIAPRQVFTLEDKSRSDAAEAQAAVEQLTTITRQLSYAKGEDIVRLLIATKTITKYGQAQVDPRTNMLIVTDLPGQIARVQDLVNTLDFAQPQVEIEARIVQTRKTYARSLGVQWGFNGRVDPALGNTTNLAFPNKGTLGGQATEGGAPTGTAVNLPATPGKAPIASAVGLALGSINGAFNLDMALSAGETSGNLKVLSTPRVSTQNNVEAEIAQGVQVPYQTVSNNTVTTNFKDAALTLKVNPQITASGTVIMKIAVDNGSVGDIIAGQPSINTQRATTQVLVNDGQTTVIGGIYSSSNHTNNDRTPGLSRIPLLRWLFRRDSMDEENTELLIFITPRIIK
jgi:type IV pilus assembly protein PilQ